MHRLQKLREKLEIEVGFKFKKNDNGRWVCCDDQGHPIVEDVSLGKCIEKAGASVGEE